MVYWFSFYFYAELFRREKIDLVFHLYRILLNRVSKSLLADYGFLFKFNFSAIKNFN